MRNGNAGRAPRVLVVDDDPEMCALLKDVLEREHFAVLVSVSASEALAAVDRLAVDAVILDKEMPGMSGFEMLAVLRRRRPNMPVIMITAFGGPRTAGDAITRGASGYLEKPFRMAALISTVRQVTRPRDR